MRTSFQTKPESRIDLEFGYNTKLFTGMYWFSIVRVYIGGEGEIYYASLLFNAFKHYKFWFKKRNLII